MGAKSLYDPKYCQEIIDCLTEGHSITGFAGKISVGRRTVFDWLEKHADFAEAYEIAKAKSAYFWEKRHIEFSKTGEGSAAGIIFGLKNRANDDWSDVQKVQHGGEGGGPIQVNISGVDAGLL